MAGILLLAAAGASAKSIHWSALEVEARLDSDGVLHVVERQSIVFDGDWNGAERIFELRPGQKLKLHSLRRIDGRGTVELEKGDLDEVDHYDWHDGRTLRWRSRLPSDPPFRNRPIVYELDYTVSGILRSVSSSSYVLDHDFAFPDREGVIEQFTLDLALDPVWRPRSGYRESWAAEALPPRRSFVVTIHLDYSGSAPPEAVFRGASQTMRIVAISLLVLITVGITGLYFAREAWLGRFARLTPVSQIDESWLEEHLLSIPPELAGAAWDRRVGAPEVAGLIARLVSEGKLKTWTERKDWWPFRKEILHLELLVDRDAFNGYEGSIIRAIFRKNATSTNTEEIRERYRTRGFDPASKIRKPLLKAAIGLGRKSARASRQDADDGMVGKMLEQIEQATRKARPEVRLAGRWGGGESAEGSPAVGALALAFLIAASLLGVGMFQSAVNVGITLVAGALLLISFAPAAALAVQSRNRVHRVISTSMLLVILIGGITTVGGAAILRTESLGTWTLFGIVFLAILFCGTALRMAATTESRESVAVRKRLAAARRYFAEELRRREPRLRDEWFPYALAFGLGSKVDRWFRAFGGEGDHMRVHNLDASTGSGSSGSGSGWTGGGGAFGGAGATASWSAAVGSFASGVPSPSSSGSSGGSSGGGSSGGGGGGGW